MVPVIPFEQDGNIVRKMLRCGYTGREAGANAGMFRVPPDLLGRYGGERVHYRNPGPFLAARVDKAVGIAGQEEPGHSPRDIVQRECNRNPGNPVTGIMGLSLRHLPTRDPVEACDPG
jgi:hypothetical protein